jgi:GNAT superfamily N-acetyltransferase
MKIIGSNGILPTENGYYPLAPGKLAAFTVYYEYRAPFNPKSPKWPAGTTLHRLGPNDGARYRSLFRTVGAPLLWTTRIMASDEELEKILSSTDVEVYAAKSGEKDIGLIELNFKSEESVEIVYIGVISSENGKRVGAGLVSHALLRARERNAHRLWLHTCHFDSPGASRFYERFGFKPISTAVEIMDDPRLNGTLPSDLAPHIPLVPFA